jgi:hypothetical protein
MMKKTNKSVVLSFMKRQKRSTLLLVSLVLLIVAALGGLNLYARHLAGTTISTPIPPPPDMPEDIESDSIPKSQSYEDEIRREMKGIIGDEEREERWNRISMSWDQVYEQAQADSMENLKKRGPPKAEPAETKLKKPKPKVKYGRRQSARRTTFSQLKKEGKIAKEQGSSGFNLKTQANQRGKGMLEEKTEASHRFVRAMIAGNYRVRTGETVSLQLLEPVSIDGRKIPELDVIAGRVSFSNNRVRINVETISLEGEVVSVNWDCYDQHLALGLPYEGSIKSAEEEVEDRVLRSAERDLNKITSRIPYVSDLAEGAIGAVKSIRRTRRGKARLPNNYHVYLKIKQP